MAAGRNRAKCLLLPQSALPRKGKGHNTPNAREYAAVQTPPSRLGPTPANAPALLLRLALRVLGLGYSMGQQGLGAAKEERFASGTVPRYFLEKGQLPCSQPSLNQSRPRMAWGGGTTRASGGLAGGGAAHQVLCGSHTAGQRPPRVLE